MPEPELEFRVTERRCGTQVRFQVEVLLNGVVIDELILLNGIQMIGLKQCLEDWAEEQA